MQIIVLKHPVFSPSKSNQRYSRFLASGLRERGHQVETWEPSSFLYRFPAPSTVRKWLGYVDQYVIFAAGVRKRLQRLDSEALFVLSDQALGIWTPLIAQRPHVIHCHDFLALQSARGQFPENPTGWTGRRYQQMILNGFRQGRNFISVSKKTQTDLESLLTNPPDTSEVVYNGLHMALEPQEKAHARRILGNKLGLNLSAGFWLHVGGNQWYKNRKGVLEIYEAYRKTEPNGLPLLMIGAQPTPDLLAKANSNAFHRDIHFLTSIDDETLRTAYAAASLFLFPSLEEGFGWPVAEAMASGTLVATTDRDPMREVGGNAATYLPRRPSSNTSSDEWAISCAGTLGHLLRLPSDQADAIIVRGLRQARQFNAQDTLDKITSVYQRVLSR